MSLLDKASLIVTPNAYKESKLYSVIPSDGSGDMTVVRATTATRVNSAGLIEVVPRNLFTYSEQFNDTSWLKGGGNGASVPTVTANTISAPNGTLTADTVVFPSVSGSAFSLIYKVPSIIGNYTTSIYLKGATGGEVIWMSWTADGVNYLRKSLSITTDWQRFDFNANISSSSSGIQFGIDLRDNQQSAKPSQTIYFWGAQLESFPTATEYFPTTTRLNIPRIDYTNGSCPSLLVEPQRTNLYTYSQQLNQWSKSGVITVTENDEISPEGTQNADRAQFTLSTDLLFRSGTGLAGSNTLTVYAKAKSGTSQKFRFFGLGGGTFSSDQVATNQWQRFTFTYTSAATNTAGLSGASTGASDVLFYGFQHEIGAYPTSYIPTVASTVTRNADVISKTGISSLIGQTEGTIFVDIYIKDRTEQICAAIQKDGGVNYIFISQSSNKANFKINANSSSKLNYSTEAFLIGRNKAAISYNTNGTIKVFLNGVKLTQTSLSSFTFSNVLSSLYLFDDNYYSVSNTSYNNSTQLYKTALNDAELQSLTTL